MKHKIYIENVKQEAITKTINKVNEIKSIISFYNDTDDFVKNSETFKKHTLSLVNVVEYHALRWINEQRTLGPLKLESLDTLEQVIKCKKFVINIDEYINDAILDGVDNMSVSLENINAKACFTLCWLIEYYTEYIISDDNQYTLIN